MTEIRKPAIRIAQGKRSLFMTFFTVADFCANKFYEVESLDVEKATGMQRLLNQSRVNSYSKDILGADAHNQVFLPTSVFLATSGDIGYDENTRELFFNSSPDGTVCPFSVVDGQHRIEGFKQAAKKGETQLMNFPIPTVIAPNLSEPERMLQFVVVNTKQTPVVKDVAQHIISRFTKMLEVEEVPYLPSWLKKATEKGDDEKALDMAIKFHNDPESPWYGKIQLGDKMRDKTQHTIKQATFVGSIKKYLFAKSHPFLSSLPNSEKRMSILNNYWKAIENIFVDSNEPTTSIVFKYSGLQFFLAISAPVLNSLARNRSYKVSDFEQCIRSVEAHLQPEFQAIMFPEYWQRGSDASGLNGAAIAKLAAGFTQALAEANANDEITI